MRNGTDLPNAESHNVIEADDGSEGSSYGSLCGPPPPATLTSSVADYIYENGRRYHRYAEGKYAVPNDETEQDRLDFYHHQQLLMLKGNLFTAPIRNDIKKVLDCGTGTGIWALDMAENYPDAEILGVDLSPIQPEWTLPNCSFEIDDLELEWEFPRNYFDFIHSRQLTASIKDWDRYAAQMFKCCKPGGYVELCEFQLDGIHTDDCSLTPDHGLYQYYVKMREVTKLAGIKLPTAELLTNSLERAGFVDIKVLSLKQPFAPWPKDKDLKRIGQLSLVTLVENKGIESYGLALFTRYGGMTQTEAQLLCDSACEDLKNKKIHVYNYLWHFVGRKPEVGEVEMRKLRVGGK